MVGVVADAAEVLNTYSVPKFVSGWSERPYVSATDLKVYVVTVPVGVGLGDAVAEGDAEAEGSDPAPLVSVNEAAAAAPSVVAETG